MEVLMSWLHLVAVVVWLGGLGFLLFAVLPQKSTDPQNPFTPSMFVSAAQRFRPVLWAAMAVVVGSGVFRIVEAGGMKNLPTLIHIKIGIALLMVIISLVTSLYILPRIANGGEIAAGYYRGYVALSVLVLLLGLAIFWLLSYGGLL
jgi:uncharacterized membrane protein